VIYRRLVKMLVSLGKGDPGHPSPGPGPAGPAAGRPRVPGPAPARDQEFGGTVTVFEEGS